MPVQAPLKPVMEAAILQAFANAATAGASEGANPASVIQDLAKEIADAVDLYVKGIIVTVTVQPGQVVTTPTGPGATSTPGIGTS